MLNYVHQFFKIRVFSRMPYLRNYCKLLSPYFLAFLTQITHYLTAVIILKNYINWKIFTRTSLIFSRG